MRAGPLDNGKMWLFEEPPLDYLEATYGFRPDEAWLERARLAALRLPGCSASFVSRDGLVATNHHCVRGAIVGVGRPGERLLDEGFFAYDLEEERRAEGLYVDQLVAIDDVTERIEAALAGAETDAERAAARQEAIAALEAEMTGARGGPEAGFRVQVVSLYNGGRYSAYTFRRYDDLRLVAAPELQLGYFGGDSDNFTFPRYALDFAFLRVYGPDGRPLDSSAFHFSWTEAGVEAGDLVFVIGNPGSTNRGDTVEQLRWRRDVQLPAVLEMLESRIAALEAYLEEHPEDDASRNQVFGLLNSQKAYRGRQEALRDTVLMARRADAERAFREALEADPALLDAYGGLIDEMAEVQRQKRELAAEYGAFTGMTGSFGSAVLRRALLAEVILRQRAAGLPAEASAPVEEALREVADLPPALERRYLAAQLAAVERFMEPALAEALLQGRSPEAAAEALLAATALADSARTAEALAAGALAEDDPAVAAAGLLGPRYADFQSAFSGLSAREGEIARRLGRARFDVYGTAVPPDATFSPRFTDGVVRGYDYNGTVAPPYTTMFGLYERTYAFGPGTEWELPARWLPAPDALDLATPLNFVSTSDTIGGNSGSPAVTPGLELVGLNFDRTVEGLGRDYIYFAERGRNVMVDARAVTETLTSVYGLERIVEELRTGTIRVTNDPSDE